jgi:Protein of unknown function (DUF3225)
MRDGDINLPHVVAEVTAVFERYETALVSNDVVILDELFWPDPRVLRFGSNENLYGIDAIRDFRKARSTEGLVRTLSNTSITTFGTDFAVANTEFYRADKTRCGRQSQTWVKLEAGWKVVAAHVSIIEIDK